MTKIKDGDGKYPIGDDSCGPASSISDNHSGAGGSARSGDGGSRDSNTEASLSFTVKNSLFSSEPNSDFKRQPSSITDSGGQRRRSSTTALRPQPRRSNDLSDLTIDKIDFTKVGLYGRDKEVAALKWGLDQLILSNETEEDENANDSKNGTDRLRMRTSSSSKRPLRRQLTLISGVSGTGKTALTNSLKRPTKKRNGLFVTGKFDLNNGLAQKNKPYAGIATACAAICGAILQLQIDSPNAFDTLRRQIQEDVGSELSLLAQFIPVLNEVVDLHTPTSRSDVDGKASDVGETQQPSSLEDSKNRFRFAFLRFFRIVSNHFFPLVMVLDDLQWADAGSIDLLDVLVSDRLNDNNSTWYIIGTYRSNEVDETHIFHHAIKDLEAKRKQDETLFEMTQLEIGNLDVDSVQLIIQDLLSTDDESSRVLGLAHVCLQKTHGNVFYLLQFLTMLQENQLLQFNFGTLSWIWDEQEIEAGTSASDNVIDMLKDKMCGLSDDLIAVLQLAACLGSTFDVQTLLLVWANMTSLSDDQEASAPNGRDAIRDEQGCWSHDQIHLAAASLMPENERAAFGRRMGEILISHLDSKELDSAIFVVVNLLNGYSDDRNFGDNSSRLHLAQLNLEASRKAISLSAFESAADYASKGVQLLPDNHWRNHYPLSQKLYTVGAKAEGYIGNAEAMENYCKALIGQQDRPILDKFDVYITWVDSILNRGHIVEACDLLFDILKKFKCRFPKNAALVGVGIVSNVVQIKATMKSRDANKLDKMGEQTRVELMSLLDKLATCLYQAKDDRMPLVVFRSLSYTMKYGFCDFSPVAFATTGIMLTGILDDLQGGARYGQQALDLLPKTSGVTAARTYFCVHSFSFPFTKPLRDLLKPLIEGYNIGLKTGDTESATWSIYHWLTLKFMLGTSLETLEKDFLIYAKQMKDLKREQAEGACKYSRQAFLNIMGRNSNNNPTRMIGDAMSEEDYKYSLQNTFLSPGIHLFQTLLYSYFGEYVKQADAVVKLGHDYLAKAHVASPNNMWYTLLTGICCFAAARQTGQKKYAKIGNVMRSKLKKWLDMGNPNVKHYESFLDAEWNALKGKNFAAIKQFEVAILLAARGGFQHDAAFASERLGEFQLTAMADREEASYRFQQSVEYWRNWGAMAKVQHLQDKYSHLMAQPTEIFAMSPISEAFVS